MLKLPDSFLSRAFAEALKNTCSAACWNCNHLLNTAKSSLFCESCHKIQPPTCDNFFQLFDQPKQYKIDVKKLDKSYLSLQRKVHPDRFYSKTEKEKELSIKASGCINEGYHTLRNPVSRGEYLLHLFNQKVVTDVPQDFLMEVLEFHEEMDNTNEPDELIKLLQKAQKMMKDLTASLASTLEIKDGKLAKPGEAAIILSKLKYLSRIRDTLKQKIPVNKL
ncbi:co-chaperone Hsc20 family protein [Trichomonas vaginalis G3]|uniref:Co-chaperone Hsc20 family protein n=1 Tax=Trichomonas vaginalis (strain ATCC PRA-98 / G3) TaxID=412133 RepID=A2FIE5_TRIV3|nr:protein maturation by iron-sulfur cluster transfer [Trichomonas vaginalis G3]EAX95307.1 co-chaperone Hsc20 family protein [Trichomonas vaginalis G3]KAI5500574.1 protein maturation by iron-sulfur cluster transfer [Trichomonas vaginalis G3]|eukprot:XP_001308237.1 co-chaperone Hsc20 family protein [Trichomonas vaginalis G3]